MSYIVIIMSFTAISPSIGYGWSDTRMAVLQTAYKINVIDKGTLGYESYIKFKTNKSAFKIHYKMANLTNFKKLS